VDRTQVGVLKQVDDEIFRRFLQGQQGFGRPSEGFGSDAVGDFASLE
jgi:hypothetical protein